MIITIRRAIKEHAGQWIGAVVLAMLAFGLFYTPSMRRTAGSSAWALDINTAKTSQFELRLRSTNVQRQMDMLRAQYGQVADLILQMQGLSTKSEENAVYALMRESLLDQTASKLGLRFSNAYSVENMARAQQELLDIVPMEVFDPYRGLNVKRLQQWLVQNGLSEEYLHHTLGKVFARQLTRDLAAQANYIPTYLLEHEALQRTAARTFSTLTFSREPLLKQEQNKSVTSEEIVTFYNQENAQKQRYWIPEKRAGIVWTFEPASYGISIAEDAIAEYYANHKSSKYVQEPTKVQVRHILFTIPSAADRQAVLEKAHSVRSQLVADPTTFAAKAQELSADTTSAKDGGLLPFFSRGERDRAFEKVAFTLKADGDISQVIETEKGLEIIQRIAKKDPVFKPLKQVQADIEKILLGQKFDEMFTESARVLVDDHAQNPAALETFVGEKKGKKTTISGIDRTNQDWGKHLFKMGKGDLAFFLEKNTGMLVLLTDIAERHLPAVSAIEAQVKHDLYEERATQALKKLTVTARKAALTHPLSDVQKQLGGTLATIASAKPDDTKNNEILSKKGIPVDQIFQIENIGGVIDYPTENSLSVIRLDSIDALTQEQLAAAIAQKKDTIEQESAGRFVRGFIASLARHATIKVNEVEQEDLGEQDVPSEEE